MEKITIQGKDYITVNERLKEFRENEIYKGWALITKIIELNDKVAVFQAEIINDKGVLIATGTAREVNGDSFINKTSYVENAETSAWGRALGNLGIGIDTSVATYEEVANAQLNQNKQTPMTFEQAEKESIYKSKSKVETIETDIEEHCPKCGSKLILKSGQYGKFWSCSNYPECTAKQKKYIGV